jgi:hypothetical protein
MTQKHVAFAPLSQKQLGSRLRRKKKGGEQGYSPPQLEDDGYGLLLFQIDIAAKGGKLHQRPAFVDDAGNSFLAYSA